MAKNRFTWWQRVKDSSTKAALEEQGQAISNLEAAGSGTTSSTPTSGCLATRTAGQSIGSGTQMVWTQIDFNPAEELDSSGVFTAAESGYYALAFYVYLGSVGSTNRGNGYFVHNGVQLGYAEQLGGRTAALSIPLYPLDAGDTIAVKVGYTGGGTLTTDAGYAGCFLSIMKVGDL